MHASRAQAYPSTLHFSGTSCIWDFPNGVRTLIGRISGGQIAQLREEYGPEIFAVRSTLPNENDRAVITRLIASATGPRPHEFVLLNAGITMLCRHFDCEPVSESPAVQVDPLQVIDGIKTNALYEAYAQYGMNDSVEVLVRIVETSNPKILAKTRVTAASFP